MNPWPKAEADETQKIGWRYLVRKVFVQPDGDMAEYYTKDKMGSRSVAVIALTGDNKVIIAEQFRPGPEKIMLELPGGGVEEDEDLATAALRELEEETGYTSDEVTSIGMVYKDAYTNTSANYYLAKNCRPLPGGQNLDHGEFVTVQLISIEQLLNNSRSGLMTDTEGVYLAYEELKRIA